MSLQASLPKDGGKKAYVEARNVAMKAKVMATDMPDLPPFSIVFEYTRHKPNAINVKDRRDLASLSCISIIKEKVHKMKNKNEAKIKNLLLGFLMSNGLINR